MVSWSFTRPACHTSSPHGLVTAATLSTPITTVTLSTPVTTTPNSVRRLGKDGPHGHRPAPRDGASRRPRPHDDLDPLQPRTPRLDVLHGPATATPSSASPRPSGRRRVRSPPRTTSATRAASGPAPPSRCRAERGRRPRQALVRRPLDRHPHGQGRRDPLRPRRPLRHDRPRDRQGQRHLPALLHLPGPAAAPLRAARPPEPTDAKRARRPSRRVRHTRLRAVTPCSPSRSGPVAPSPRSSRPTACAAR